MTGKEIQFNKKWDTGDIFSDSFRFLKQEFKPLSQLTLVYVLPFLILYAYANVYFQKDILWKLDFSDSEKLISQLGPNYAKFMIVTFFEVFVQSLMITAYYSYIEVYVKKGKGNFELKEVTEVLFSNGLLVIAASVAFFVIVVTGLILCIVPGLFFANSLSLTFIALIFEKKGVTNALTRSANLVRPQWWNTFLINFVGLIIIYVAGVAVNWVVTIILDLAGMNINVFENNTSTEEYPAFFMIMMGLKVVISSLFYFIPYTFLAFQYFNLTESSKPADFPELPS